MDDQFVLNNQHSDTFLPGLLAGFGGNDTFRINGIT